MDFPAPKESKDWSYVRAVCKCGAETTFAYMQSCDFKCSGCGEFMADVHRQYGDTERIKRAKSIASAMMGYGDEQ